VLSEILVDMHLRILSEK